MPNETNGEDFFKSINCPVTNCILTHDKNYLSEPHNYDAIVFHGAEAWNRLDLPETRSSDQLYVLANLEAPPETRHNFRLDHDFYNLTMTYRLDSDILWTYGKFIDISSGIMVAPSTDVQWREPENVQDNDLYSMVFGKTKEAAWFVSHCNAFSNRDKLTKKLQKHINVDVYGRCGTKECPHNEQEKCDKMLNSTYKFYLSFENSLCVDYVTEKLFNAMEKNIIPVVFNGADMTKFVPPKSIINANDFETVEELALYLKFLSHDLEEYQKYFWWKKYYKLIVNPFNQGFCNLCKKINEMNRTYKKQIYENIEGWWYEGACEKSKIKF